MIRRSDQQSIYVNVVKSDQKTDDRVSLSFDLFYDG